MLQRDKKGVLKVAVTLLRLCIEIEWEICHVDLSLQSNLWDKLQIERLGLPSLLWQLLANMLFGDVWILAADENY